jgi:hypothetical protein
MNILTAVRQSIQIDSYPVISKSNIDKLLEIYEKQATIDAIVQNLKELATPFPYGKFFINDDIAKEKFTLLREFQDNWNNDNYRINSNDQPYKPFPLTYKRKYMLYIPKDSDYHLIDNLTCAFTDESRMDSFRYVTGLKTESPAIGWNKYGEYVGDSVNSIINHSQALNAYNLREGLYKSSKRQGCPYTECAHERLCFLAMVFKELRELTKSLPFKVFDSCAGWGDRLIVSMAFGAERYIGVEPNKKSKDGFDRCIRLLGDPNKHQVLCDGCPNVKIPGDDRFSMVFLSPPAYNSEFYSNDDKQSVQQFSNFNDWILGFLIPTIDLCWRKLEVGGVLVIQSLLAAKINCYIEAFCQGSDYIGALSIRTGRNRNKPLWIWMKTIRQNRQQDSPKLESVLGREILDRLMLV